MSFLTSRSVVVVGSRIGGHPDLPDIGGWWRDDVAKSAGPAVQRLALLGLVTMSIVDRLNTLLLMAEDQLGDEGRDPERGQICPGSSSQIVEAPIGQPASAGVDHGFVKPETGNCTTAAGG